MVTMNIIQFNTFKVRYQRHKAICEMSWQDPLRFGQKFLNDHYPNDCFPELFYEEDARKAEDMIRAKYVTD